LLFPIRDKLEENRKQEEAKFKEEGRVPVDPTVFWIKQTVRSRWCRSTNIVIMDEIRSATHAERSVFYMP
jgi:hypothetical protein